MDAESFFSAEETDGIMLPWCTAPRDPRVEPSDRTSEGNRVTMVDSLLRETDGIVSLHIRFFRELFEGEVGNTNDTL